MRYFQIIFNPTSAAELSKMPKDLQLHFLGEFKGLPAEAMNSGVGRLEHGRRTLYRYRVGDYRVYYETNELGAVVHRILGKNSVRDFMFRNVNMTADEDASLQENPKFWRMIDEARRAVTK